MRNLFALALLGTMLLSAANAHATFRDCTPGTYTVDFLGVMYNPNGTSTWTYAVGNDDPDCISGLDNFTIGICCDATVVSPVDNANYYTIAWDSLDTEVAGIKYKADLGYDLPSLIYGIEYKHKDGTQLGNGNLDDRYHVFQFTLDKWYAVGEVGYDVDYGFLKHKFGSVAGASCQVIPLPAAAWSGLAGMGLVVLPALRRATRRLVA